MGSFKYTPVLFDRGVLYSKANIFQMTRQISFETLFGISNMQQQIHAFLNVYLTGISIYVFLIDDRYTCYYLVLDNTGRTFRGDCTSSSRYIREYSRT